MSDVLTAKKEGIGRLTLNRISRHNSLVPEFLQEIKQALASFAQDPEIRVVLLSANGKTFSTGGDVSAFYQHRHEAVAYSEAVVGGLNELLLAMLDCPLPIITAVHGLVTGGSIGFVLASDVVLLSPKATFTPYYATVGFCPDGGWTGLMKQVIGPKRTAEILMTDRTITAQEAVDWGVASRIVPPEQLMAEAETLARRMISLKQGSISHAKALLRDRDAAAQGLAQEKAGFIRQITSEEGQSGMAAFVASLKAPSKEVL